MRQRDLDGFRIEPLGEFDGAHYSLFGFARKADHEISMHGQTQFAAVLHESERLLDGDSLLHVIENFLDAGFKAHDQKTAARFLHGLEHIVVGMYPAVAGPGEIEPLEVPAKLDYAGFSPCPGVVVEKDFLYFREQFKCALDFGNNAFGAANAPGMPGESLRPEAVDTSGRAPARCIKRKIGMFQKRDVVFGRIEIAPVYFNDKGKRIQIFDGRPVGIVNDFSVFPVADPLDLLEVLSRSEFGNSVVEFLSCNEIDCRGRIQRLFGLDRNGRTDKGDLDGRD